ncbi:heme biosynthesis protein HemY [Nordella sp. HKS 07]|uniref:heme biosynthesis protein HemY n=1 Tax=Nordella sp. HKS 07 TaxID=2712222 RepID=UPI0013E108CA|nr:heme biosynthesis HemY N-terminal domain-containing protein [Nordella sp. HKS 07]QIG48016.1 heme biosynthesis protein HemY [Nordella sp. HKS 07]
MTRLLFRFLLLAAAAAGFAWIADRPGTIVIRWLNHEIETSVVAGLAGLILAMLALWFLLGLLRRLIGTPGAIGGYFRFRKARRGYESLSRGIIAAGAGDGASAQRFATIAAKSLTDEPLLKLLEVQAAQLKGDRGKVRQGFEAMLNSPETEALGLRGLFAEARQAGDLVAARGYAERALKLNVAHGWASSALLAIQSQARDWDSALVTLETQRKAGQAPADKVKRVKAVLLAAKALAAETGDRNAALDWALEAHKLDPSLVPAAAMAVRLYGADGALRRAWRVASRTWALQPHPDLAEAYAYARPTSPAQERYERVRRLIGSYAGGIEGAFALGRAAAEARQWDDAAKALEPLLSSEPQARVCATMAEVEEGRGDKGRAREWLARAVRAPSDPMWVIDGAASPYWTPISPMTGEIAFAEWKVPYDQLPRRTGPEPQAPAPESEYVVAEEAPALAAPAVPAEPPPAPEPPAPTPVPSPPPAPPVARKPAKPRIVEPVRPPDDPGLPEDDPELSTRRSPAEG